MTPGMAEAWQVQAMWEGLIREVILPPLRTPIPPSPSSPTPSLNVSHETLQSASMGEGTPPPVIPAPLCYDAVMDTQTTTDMTQAVATLMKLIADDVINRVTPQLDEIAASALEDALDSYNPTEHPDFSDGVEEVLRNASWSVTYDG